MRNYNLNKIKSRYPYTYHEIHELFGVCNGTIKSWIRDGLAPINPHSLPRLILGGYLKTYLSQKQTSRKTKLLPNQMYCVSCHTGVIPPPHSLVKTIRNKIGKGKRLVIHEGICPHCTNTIVRFGSELEISCLRPKKDFLQKQKGLNDLPLFKVG